MLDNENKLSNKYKFVSKWVVFITYTMVEGTILSLMEWIPFLYIGSFILKSRILSSDSNVHQIIYNKTFDKLRDFDVIELLVRMNTGVVLTCFEKSIKIVERFLHLLTSDELGKLETIVRNISASIT